MSAAWFDCKAVRDAMRAVFAPCSRFVGVTSPRRAGTIGIAHSDGMPFRFVVSYFEGFGAATPSPSSVFFAEYVSEELSARDHFAPTDFNGRDFAALCGGVGGGTSETEHPARFRD
jgi:hypothetical protein